MNNPIIGFIGLGIMGKPMARNLLKAGYSLIVHNRSRAAVDELSKEGAQTAASSQEVAARSEVVITMLPDSPDVELVYSGEQGVFAGAKPGMLLIDMSSISPVVSRRLAEVAQMMTGMRSMGNGEIDHAELVALVEQLSKTELSKSKAT